MIGWDAMGNTGMGQQDVVVICGSIVSGVLLCIRDWWRRESVKRK
jgi:hypothetical protein